MLPLGAGIAGESRTRVTSTSLAPENWPLLHTAHPNVLMVGSDVAVDDALHALLGACLQSVVTHRINDGLELPSCSLGRTVVLRGVAQLSLRDQHRLMEWLGEACGRTQTVATDARPLWPRIQAGTFLAGLYYRLNTIYFDLSPDADDDPRRQ
jgi:hypothetical protein